MYAKACKLTKTAKTEVAERILIKKSYTSVNIPLLGSAYNLKLIKRMEFFNGQMKKSHTYAERI